MTELSEREKFVRGYEKGKDAAHHVELGEIFMEVYQKLYLIPDELREPLMKLVELTYQDSKDFFPEELVDVLGEKEQNDKVLDLLGIGLLQFMMGLKMDAESQPKKLNEYRQEERVDDAFERLKAGKEE